MKLPPNAAGLARIGLALVALGLGVFLIVDGKNQGHAPSYHYVSAALDAPAPTDPLPMPRVRKKHHSHEK